MKGNYTLRASAAKNHTLNRASRRLGLGEGAHSETKARSNSQHLASEKMKLRLRRGGILQGHGLLRQNQNQDSRWLLPSGLHTN